MIDVTEEVTRAELNNMRSALSTALQQVESLLGMLEPHMESDLIERLRDSFEGKIKHDLAGG